MKQEYTVRRYSERVWITCTEIYTGRNGLICSKPKKMTYDEAVAYAKAQDRKTRIYKGNTLVAEY